MLAHEPVAELPELQAWGIFRYDDLNAAMRNETDFSIERRFDRMPEEQREVFFATGTLVGIDPPRHTRLRALTGQAFRPGMIERLRGYVEATSKELLDKALEKRRFDFLKEYATPLPQAVISEMMGVPPDQRIKYIHLTRDIENSMARYIGMPVTDKQLALGRTAYENLCGVFDAVFDDRRRDPRQDMVTSLLNAEVDGQKLSQWELQKMAIFAYFAAFHTTQGLLSNSLVLFNENPDQLNKLRQRPDLIPNAVDEVLRYRAPAPVVTRMSVNEVVLHGQTIPPGSMILYFLNAGNHDGRTFTNPHAFDVERPNASRHLAFAIGAHFCLGAALARLEAQVFLTHWLAHVADYSIDVQGPLDWDPENINVLTLRSLPITVTPR